MPNANEMDFFGEGTAAPPTSAPGAAPAAGDANAWAAANKAAKPRDLLSRNPTGVGYNPAAASRAFTGGNIGGSSGAYNTVSDKGREAFDYYRDIRDPSSVKDFLNARGEDVGVSRAGDVALGSFGDNFKIDNPLDFNPLSRVIDPNTGLGSTSDGKGGQPVGASMDPRLREAIGGGIGDQVQNGLGDLLGGGNAPSFDTSGADRGGMGLGGAYSVQLGRQAGLGDSARQLGADVMSGAVAPGGAGAAGQEDALSRAMAFAPKSQQAAQKKVDAFGQAPRAQAGTMSALDQFTAAPEGPSKAQLLLDQANQNSMGDALSIARSGRARDAGSAARALNVAQAENAATGVDAARSGGLLRAQEAQDFRGQQLQALGQKGDLAKSLDTGTLGALDISSKLAGGRDQTALGALNLGSETANNIRQGNIAERGQTLNFGQGQQQIGAGLDADVLKTIPALEQIRHEDQYDLTPQQKLAQAQLSGGPEKTTADYVTGLLGDVLGAL